MKTLKQRTEEAIAAGWSVGELAKAAGKSSQSVSQWKSGSIQTIKADSALGLEKLTGWSATWWATGKGPKQGSAPRPDSAALLRWRDTARDMAANIPDQTLRQYVQAFLGKVDAEVFGLQHGPDIEKRESSQLA